MDRESVPAKEIQSEVERREPPTVAAYAPNARRQYIIYIARMNVYTSACARMPDEACMMIGLKESGTTQAMLAHDLPALHGHYTNGVCVREFIPVERAGAARLSDAWEACRAKGREASRY